MDDKKRFFYAFSIVLFGTALLIYNFFISSNTSYWIIPRVATGIIALGLFMLGYNIMTAF